jgi:uncharacterized repeat protein (TIGR01451 family)
LTLLLALLAGTTHFGRAHSITVGDDTSVDWLSRAPLADNTAIVARNATEQGEYLWKDAAGDENTALNGGADPSADIREVRYTGDATNLFVLVKLASISVASGANAPQVQLAIDKDRTPGSGSQSLVQGAETDVADAGRWEYLAQTRFGTGNANVALWQNGAGAPAFVGAADAATNGTVELSIPWASLGLAGPPTSPLRFTLGSFRSNASDGTVDVGGAGVSNGLDVVTDYGDPGTSPNTTTELGNQRIDYFADVSFTPGGEVRAPVVVSGFSSNIGAPNQAAEWIEVANASPVAVNLSAFKLGDSKMPDDGAAMYTFPTGTMLVPGGRFLIARSGSAYNTAFGSLPGAEFADTSPAVPNMDSFTPWGTSSLDLDDAGDVIVLLDGSNTTIDADPYGTGAFTGVNAITPAPAAFEVQARALSLRDTDDADSDFGAVGCSGTKVWTGAGGNNSWFTAANWSGGTLPGPADHVCIPDTGLATISFASNTNATVASLTSNEKFTLTNGALTLDPPSPSTQPSTVSALDFAGGFIEGDGDLSITGTFNWTDGEFRAPATSVKVMVGGLTTISGNVDHNVRFRRLDFNGGTTWNAGRILLAEGAWIRNRAGQTFLAQSGNNIQHWFGATTFFANEGTFTKAGAGTVGLISGVQFNNTGTASVDAGTLQLEGGTSTGSIAVPTASTLRFAAGTNNLNAGSDISGAGALNFSGGTTNINGGYTHTGPISLTSSGTAVFAPSLNVNVLSQTGSSSVLVVNSNSPVASYTFSDGIQEGSGDLNVAGAFTWNGGEFRAPTTGVKTTVGGPATIGVNVDHNMRFRRLDLNGGATWDAGRILVAEGASIRNANGQTFVAQSGNNLQQWFGATSAFINEGAFAKAGAGTVGVISGTLFHNSGSVSVDAGTLQVEGGTSSGSFGIANGTTLRFNGGTHNLSAGSDISGAGALNFSGGTTNINGGYTHTGPISLTSSGTAVFAPPLNGNVLSQTGSSSVLVVNSNSSAASYTFTDGIQEGSGDLNVAGAFTWNGGEFRSPNTTVKTTVAGATTIGVNTDHNVRFRRLDFNGGTTWNAGRILLAEGASIRNPAGQTFLAQSGANIQHWFGATSSVINEGTFTKAGAATVALISGTLFHNSGSATVAAGLFEIQGGTSSGSFDASAGSTLQLNGGTHNLTTTSTVTGAGTVRFANGTVNVAGTYDVTSLTDVTNGTVNFNTAGPLDETPAKTDRLTQSDGTIGGDDTLQVTGSYMWSGGTQTGNGQTLIDPGATLTIVGASHTLSGKRLLTTKGTTTWTSPGSWSFGGGTPSGATVRNSGTWTIGDGQSITNSGGERAFFNEAGGLVRKIGSASGQTANWSAEDGTGSNDGTVVGIPSWNRPAGSNMTVVAYDSAGFPTTAQAPAGAGNNFFAGGPTPGQSTISQIVELGGNAAAIDAGQFSAALEGELGGEGAQNDAMTVHVVFMSGGGGAGTEVGRLTLGPVLAADRGNQTGFVFRSANGALPAGTRSARLELVANNATGAGYNNAYADKIKLRFRDAESWLGSSTFNVPFDNDSTVAGGGVQIGHGTLAFSAGGPDQSLGTFVLDNGAALEFSNGTHDIGSATAGSISGVGTVRVTNGTANVRAGYDVTRTVLRNGTLAFVKTAAGDATPATTATFVQSDGNVAGDDRFEVSGAHVWTGGGHFGSGETRLLNSGTGSIDGAFKQIGDTRTFRNQGSITWTGGDRIRMGNCNSPGVFRNEGTLNVTAAVSFEACGGVVQNPGTIVKTGANTFTIGSPFDNDGALNVNGGTVNMTGGGPDESGGAYTPVGGATLQFGGGNHTLATTSSVTGAGTLLHTTGTTTVNSGTYSVANTTITNGTLVMNMTGASDETPATTTNYGQSDGTLSGTERFDISGNFAWSGGGQFGAGETRVLAGAAGTISGAFKQIGDTRTFRNQTTLGWTGGDRIRMGSCNSPSLFRNEGTLNVPAAVSFEGCGGVVQNPGTIVKTGANTFTIGSPFDNDGALNVNGGTVNMNAGGPDQSGGAYTTATAATLQFGGGTHTLGTTSGITGAGTISHTSGTTTVNSGTYDVATTNLSGGTFAFNTTDAGDTTPAKTAAFNHSDGTLSGDERFDVSVNENWTGGGQFGSGETRILAAATLAISGGFKQIGDTRVVRNQGTATWTAGDRIRLGSCNSLGTFRNEGTLDLRFDSNFEGCGGQVVNRALVKKTAGAGISNVGGLFDNTGGTLEVATGIVDLSGGLANYSGATRTLDGGTYILTGQLRFPGADVATNAATVVLNGVASSVVDRNNTALDGFRAFTRNAEAGDFKIVNGRNLFASPTGVRVLENDGRFGGTGTVFANFTNDSGTVAPGASPGILTVNGTYTQNAAGTLEIEVANTAEAAGIGYDRLAVTGNATLGGTIAGVGLPGFAPVTGNGVDVVTTASRGGTQFTARSTTPDPLTGNLVFQERYPTEQVVRLFEVPTASVPDVTVSVGDITASSATINVDLSAPSAETITMNYATSDGTALAGVDYTATSGSLTFSPTDATPTRESFTVPILPDGLDEFDETFNVTVSNLVNAEPRDLSATVTITDDDAPPTLSVANVAVTEGDAPAETNASFTLSLNGPSAKEIVVTAATADGTALAGQDYSHRSEQFTFAAGQMEKTFTVAVAPEDLNESDETFLVGITTTTPLNVQLPAAAATGTIVDDDTLTWRVNDVTVNEGGDAVFTVTLNRLSDALQRVSYSTGGGNATGGADYTTTTATLDIPAGSLTGTITVPTTEDANDEVDETFNLTLSGQTEGNLSDATGVGTIDDDDGPGVSIADAPVVNESDAGISDAVFAVTLSAPSAQEVKVAFASANGTASALTDYGQVSDILTIPAGATAGEIRVPVNGDTADEIDETFTVGLASPVDVTITDDTGGAQINDDDGPVASVVNKIVAEGDTGSSNAIVTVQLSALSPQPTSVTWATAAGTATAGEDYTTSTDTLTIPANTPSGTIAVPITGDIDDEADETILVNLSAPVDLDGTENGQITIDDDDGVGGGGNATLSIDNVSLAEGDSGATNAVFNVALTGTPSAAVSVSYATADGTATNAPDYDSRSGTLNFGTTAGTQTISVPVNGDKFDEANETFTVNLSAPVGASLDDAQGLGTITDDDESPVADGQSQTTNEDTAKAITLAARDEDADTLTYDVVAAPAHGSVTGTGANRTYTPHADYNGPDSFKFKANDGANDSNEATVSVTVNAVNDAPAAIDDLANISEDGLIEIAALANDVDVDGDDLHIESVADPAGGQATITGEGSTAIEYRPDPNDTGFDTFDYTIEDTSGVSATGSITVLVTAVNDAPVANDAVQTTAEDTAKEITLTSSDVEGSPRTYSIVSGPAHGTLSAIAGDKITYTPAANYNGVDSFRFKANDGALDSPAATISITVTPVNDGPTAGPVSVTTAEDTAIGVTLAGTDFDGDALTYTVTVNPTKGSVSSGTSAGRTYTPNPNANGADEFTYQVSDGVLTATATVSILINAVNDAPVADDAGPVAAVEDTEKTITFTSSDVEASPRTYSIVSGPAHGTMSAIAGDQVTYTPAANYNGPDSFRFKANDGSLDSTPATISITVAPVNDAPVATDDDSITVEGAPRIIDVVANDDDVDGDTLSVTGRTNGDKGTTSITDDGRVRYVPDDGEVGLDSFTYTVSDGTAPDTGTVSIEIVSAGTGGATLVTLDDGGIAEGNAGEQTLDVTVELSREATVPVEVRLSTNNGTATGGPDYGTLNNQRVDFAVGESEKTVRLKINGDTLDEHDETFSLVVSSSSGAGVGDGSATVTINDDDPEPSLSIGSVDVNEGDAGSQTAVLGVSLSAPSGKTVGVDYATADGTAAQPADYTPTSGRLTFAPGETSKTITVSVHGDPDVELNETLTVQLAGASNAGLAAPTGTVTVVNDDSLLPPPPPPLPPPAVPTADLALTMTGPATSAVDRSVTFAIGVRNNGPDAATGVVVTDTLAAGLQFVSANAGTIACSGTQMVSCPLGTLASGATAAVTVIATTLEPGVHTNTAAVAGQQADPAAGNNSASATTRVPLPVVRETAGGRAGGCTQRGTSGDDVLRGGPGVDIFCGGAGNDILIGFGGNDRLLGGAGNDRIFGGPGRDSLKGGAGSDTLLGGSGNDRLDGGRGRDMLVGDRGNDILLGSFGDDLLIGGQGKDRNLGGPGDDTMRRDAQDASAGGPGADRCGKGVGRRCP